MMALCYTPRSECFSKSGVSKKKVRSLTYVRDPPPTPTKQCCSGREVQSSCPNTNSLFHPKPGTLTISTLNNIDCRGRGGSGVSFRRLIHFFYRNTGTRDMVLQCYQSNNLSPLCRGIAWPSCGNVSCSRAMCLETPWAGTSGASVCELQFAAI